MHGRPRSTGGGRDRRGARPIPVASLDQHVRQCGGRPVHESGQSPDAALGQRCAQRCRCCALVTDHHLEHRPTLCDGVHRPGGCRQSTDVALRPFEEHRCGGDVAGRGVEEGRGRRTFDEKRRLPHRLDPIDQADLRPHDPGRSARRAASAGPVRIRPAGWHRGRLASGAPRRRHRAHRRCVPSTPDGSPS